MVTRTKKTVVNEQHTSAEEKQTIHASIDEVLGTEPQWSIVKKITLCTMAFLEGLGWGWLAGMLINTIVTAVLVLTGSAFVAVVLTLLLWALALTTMLFMPSVTGVLMASGLFDVGYDATAARLVTSKRWVLDQFDTLRGTRGRFAS